MEEDCSAKPAVIEAILESEANRRAFTGAMGDFSGFTIDSTANQRVQAFIEAVQLDSLTPGGAISFHGAAAIANANVAARQLQEENKALRAQLAALSVHGDGGRMRWTASSLIALASVLGLGLR